MPSAANLDQRLAEIRAWNNRLAPILRADDELTIASIGMTRTDHGPGGDPVDQYQATVVGRDDVPTARVQIGRATGPVVDHMVEAHNMIGWLVDQLTAARRAIIQGDDRIAALTADLHELSQPNIDTGPADDSHADPVGVAQVVADLVAGHDPATTATNPVEGLGDNAHLLVGVDLASPDPEPVIVAAVPQEGGMLIEDRTFEQVTARAAFTEEFHDRIAAP